MKKTIFFTSAIVIALFLSFTLTGGLVKDAVNTPVVQSYTLTSADSTHSFYVAGYSNISVTTIDTGYCDSVYIQLGGSDANEAYALVAFHDIENTTLTTLATKMVGTSTSLVKTGVIPAMNGANYPYSWLKVIKKGVGEALVVKVKGQI